MPEISALSPRRTPKISAKNHHLRSPMQHIGSKTANGSPKISSKSGSLAPLNADRKRRAPSVSSVSSVSSIELGDGDGDGDGEGANGSDDDADDEGEPSAVRAPSYDHRPEKAHKTGRKSTKKMKMFNGEDYGAQDRGDENDSDGSLDDIYAAVDDITDDDNEDQDVEKLEELMIVESEDENRIGGMMSASGVGNANQWASTGAFDDHMLLTGASFFDEEQLYGAMDTFGEPGELASEAAPETPVPRHVHFENEADSSSDSDSHTEDEIPSDFLHQDSLDPQLRRMIENDNEATGKRRRQSDETFGDADYGRGNIYHAESDAVSEGSSGYETDDGETTDEDLPPPATITHPRSILRRDSSASLPPIETDQVECPQRRRGPVMGTFVADPSKPVALVDGSGKHLVIIPSYASSRHDWLESATNSISGTANNSPRTATMQLVDESDTDALMSPNQGDLGPMLASGANLMMTALGNDITPGGQVMGPPEAFYPSRDFTIDSSFEDDDDEDDPEESLNVDDFIDFGNGSSDEEMEEKDFESDALTSPVAPSSIQIADGTPTPNRCAEPQQGSSAERFLNHLDQGIVTAFRRNHNRYQTLLRLPHHREFMPANSPARPASVFRNARHNDPRTPPRKRKANGYAGGEAVRRKLMDAHRRSQLPF